MIYFVSGNAPLNYPAETLFGLLLSHDGQAVEIPYQYPLYGDWGNVVSSIYEDPKERPLPHTLDTVYLSIVEQKFYSLKSDLDEAILTAKWSEVSNTQTSDTTVHIVVGFAPYGLIALWIRGEQKSVLVSVFKAKPVEVKMSDFRASTRYSLNDICQRYINRIPCVKEHFKKNGLPSQEIFPNHMKQFTYRYLPVWEKWTGEKWIKYTEEDEISIFCYIEDDRYDGTHDKLHDGGLMKYHQSGKPRKLNISWLVGKTEYAAHIWFENGKIREVFNRFYGAHPETKTDFIIRIGAGQKKYELALYRYGLQAPLIIPEDAYQILVFKNKIEDFRSANYNQERGAWIW